MKPDQRIWLSRLDDEMKTRYGIDHVDAGWSSDDIERFLSFDMTPRAFVEWFGSKYELVENNSWT